MTNSILVCLTVIVIILAAIGILFLIRLERKNNSHIAKLNTKAAVNNVGNEIDELKINYNVYAMSKRERLINICTAAIVISIAAYVFYRSYIISVMAIPLALLYPKIRTKEIIKNRKYNLNLQFRDLLYSLSASLMAGKSIEGAFRTAHRDLSIQYTEKETDILKEIGYIIQSLEMNITVEDALENFSCRADIEDIYNFVNVFKICKRTGGNLVEVIKSTTDIINEKIQIKAEIENLTAQRKLEQKVLSFLPFALIALISISSADFIAPVFNTIQGRTAMTIAIALFISAYFISKKLMNIEV